MGTVGLSFGSPTSGTGFDVSATVSSIVANLENVETPWKTQLTSLQSQDTAISSMGTLLSKLSSDMSLLTDFTGVMAQKTGSSSDTNVLQLTSATSSAVAGTHTVVVKNLAATASGVLTEVPSASTQLSGYITLQVGTGTAQKISITSSNNTLQGLAQAINSSGVGVTASVLTDASGSRLSLVSGTSGANGNMTVDTSHLAAAAGPVVNYTATDDTDGTLTTLPTGDALSLGSVTIQTGNNPAQTITLNSSNNTLQGLADAINANSALSAQGITAQVTPSSDGTTETLSIENANGTVTSVSTANLTDTTATSSTLGYTSTVTGANANLSIDGVSLTSASNTVTNLIPGVTFQLLSASPLQSDNTLEPIQVIIGNDNTGVESAINNMITDYNSLISAMNTQQGNDSSGNPEPLFGSPTLSLLQSQLMQSLNNQNPNGNLDAVSSNAGTTLNGTMTIQAGNGTVRTIHLGAAAGTPNTNTDIYTTGDTIQDLADAINNANSLIDYTGSGTSTGTLTANSDAGLDGSMTIQVGDGTAVTIDAPTADDNVVTGNDQTITGLAKLINANSDLQGKVTASVTSNADGTSTLTLTPTDGSSTLTVNSSLYTPGIGVTANVATQNGESTLSLLSQVTGSSGALTVSSNLTSAPVLDYNGVDASGDTDYASGSLDSVAAADDVITGNLTLQVGSGTAVTIHMGDSTDTSTATDIYVPGNTLADLQNAITSDTSLGITAYTSSDGKTLSFISGTAGTAGNLTITSSITDAETTPLGYTTSSNITSLSGLGIEVSQSYDGTLTFDASTLDSVLNSNFSSVLGFFQGVNSWGQEFTTMLSNAGTTSSTGTLKLALSSNSNIESTLNADISREELLISAQQKSITAALNSANEILQGIPTQLESVNELYAAITGYNTKS